MRVGWLNKGGLIFVGASMGMLSGIGYGSFRAHKRGWDLKNDFVQTRIIMDASLWYVAGAGIALIKLLKK